MIDASTNEDEVSGPNSDLKAQNADETTTADLTESGGADDPHKTEKLTKAGRDIDPDEGSE